ncbi:glycosyl hydrolase family 28-related protein [Acinetobacter nosocomialis]|uniref:glycosyl hydrolase family 28-related protein n=1 Tax=Acinetobacter nosocomialis TaxID=106654 RepID=UPI00396F5DA2
MAVPEQTPFIEYTANGTTTVFPLTFDCDKAEYLIVTLDGNDAAVGSWSFINNSVNFNSAPSQGTIVGIERNTPLERTTNYQLYNNSLHPKPINKDFDLIWWKLQELGYRDQVIWLAFIKEIADRIAGDDNLQSQINTIDEWLANLQQNVNENTSDIAQLVNDLSKEIADRIKGDQILKDMFLSMIDEAINEGTINALAVTHLDSLEALEGVTNVWDGRTIYIKDLGNYRYDASTTTWVKAYQDADNVKDGAENQKEINDKNIRVLESLSDLLDYTPRKNGQTVFVKSYHKGLNKGGGIFIYDSSQRKENDGGICFNGWVRHFDGNTILVDWFGADPTGTLDSTSAIQKTINFASPDSVHFTSIEEANFATPKYSVEMSSGYYLITDTIWLPPHINFFGQGGAYYYEKTSQEENHKTYLLHSFINKNKFVIASRNWKSDGTLIDHVQKDIIGIYSNHYKCNIHGFSIQAKSQGFNNKVLGGMSLYGSARSSVYDIYITHVDIAAVFRDCFTANVYIETEHAKAGIVLKGNNNAFLIDGYLQGNTTTTPFAESPFTNLIGDIDPSTFLPDKVFDKNNIIGLYSEYNQSVVSNRIICEANDISIFNMHGNMNIRCLYSEINRFASFVALLSMNCIGDISGILDGNSFVLGLSGNISLESDNQDKVKGSRVIRNRDYGGYLKAPLGFNELNKEGVFLGDYFSKNSTIYVSADGSDSNLGFNIRSPLKSLETAFLMCQKYGASKINIIKKGTYLINEEYQLADISIFSDFTSGVIIDTTEYAKLVISNKLELININVINLSSNLITCGTRECRICISNSTINIGNGKSLLSSLWGAAQSIALLFDNVRFNYADSGSKILYTPTTDNGNTDFFDINLMFKDCSSTDGKARLKVNISDVSTNKSNNSFKYES